MDHKYFSHQFVSNSELKQISDLENGTEKPPNLQEIFDRGTLNHETLLLPHKAEITYERMLENCWGEEDKIVALRKDYQKAKEMAATVLDDELCQRIITMADFRREHEWYRIRNSFDVEGIRCKTDGDSRMASVVFEYKGLSVSTRDAFEASVGRFCYDQASAFYYEGTRLDHYLIAAVSKTNTRKMFKLMIDRGDKHHVVGDAKVRKAIRLWKSYGLK